MRIIETNYNDCVAWRDDLCLATSVTGLTWLVGRTISGRVLAVLDKGHSDHLRATDGGWPLIRHNDDDDGTDEIGREELVSYDDHKVYIFGADKSTRFVGEILAGEEVNVDLEFGEFRASEVTDEVEIARARDWVLDELESCRLWFPIPLEDGDIEVQRDWRALLEKADELGFLYEIQPIVERLLDAQVASSGRIGQWFAQIPAATVTRHLGVQRGRGKQFVSAGLWRDGKRVSRRKEEVPA